MHRYELFRMRRESLAGGSGRARPTTTHGLGFVGTHKPLTTRPGPFRVALHVRVAALDDAATASLFGFAAEAAPMDLALVASESTIYVDDAKVLRSRDALALAVSGGIYDEPGDARKEWRESFAQGRFAGDGSVEVSARHGFLRGKLFRR